MVGGVRDSLQQCVLHWPCHVIISMYLDTTCSSTSCDLFLQQCNAHTASWPSAHGYEVSRQNHLVIRSEKITVAEFLLVLIIPFQPIHACCRHPSPHCPQFTQGLPQLGYDVVCAEAELPLRCNAH